jgi:hypothetical protein
MCQQPVITDDRLIEKENINRIRRRIEDYLRKSEKVVILKLAELLKIKTD